MATSQQIVSVICQQGYLFAGVLGSAADVLLSFHAPPGTSVSSPLETLCHSWSPETEKKTPEKVQMKYLPRHRQTNLKRLSQKRIRSNMNASPSALLTQSDAKAVSI